MTESKDAPKAGTQAVEEQPYVWVSADHIANMAELHQVMVAVHPDTGAVLDPQPDYPKDPEVPPEPPPEDQPAAARRDEKK